VDRLLVAEPMRRWREWQCRAADLIVTTDRAILPPDTPAAKVIETEWGADTVRFHPGAAGSVPFARQPMPLSRLSSSCAVDEPCRLSSSRGSTCACA
jgi:hypothetical protein